MNSQHKRVHKNRVSITYDVDTDGATQSRELPFVVGVIADLSGHRQDKGAVEDRQFIRIDQDNFDQVMSSLGPQLSIKVDDRLAGDGSSMVCDLSFNAMSDFRPESVVQQVPALKELVDTRNQLMSLLGKSDRNRDLEQALRQVVGDSDLMKRLADELGVAGE